MICRLCSCRLETGEFFLNLLSMRGLVLATDSATGEAGRFRAATSQSAGILPQDIWILVSVQRDVSLLPAVDLPSNDAFMLKAQVVPRRGFRLRTEWLSSWVGFRFDMM